MRAKLEKSLFLICLLLGTLNVVEADCAKPKPIYKVTKLSLTEVGISCLNGADPTGRKVGNVVIMSCQESKE